MRTTTTTTTINTTDDVTIYRSKRGCTAFASSIFFLRTADPDSDFADHDSDLRTAICTADLKVGVKTARKIPAGLWAPSYGTDCIRLYIRTSIHK